MKAIRINLPDWPANLSPKEMRERVYAFYKSDLQNLTVVNANSGMAIRFSGKAAKHASGYRANRLNLQLFTLIPFILRHAVLTSVEPNKKFKKHPVYRFTAVFDLEGTGYEFTGVVKDNGNGNFFYDHDASEIKIPGVGTSGSLLNRISGLQHPGISPTNVQTSRQHAIG